MIFSGKISEIVKSAVFIDGVILHSLPRSTTPPGLAPAADLSRATTTHRPASATLPPRMAPAPSADSDGLNLTLTTTAHPAHSAPQLTINLNLRHRSRIRHLYI